MGDELKALFKKRDDVINAMSNDILDMIPNVMEGARQFISIQESTDGVLSWEDVTYYQGEDFIMLVGVIEYQPGDNVILPSGEEVNVTSSTAEYLKRVLRLGIPYDLAVNGSVEQVVEFLVISTQETQEAEAEMDSIQHTTDIAIADNAEFDLEGLSDDQLEQLRLFSMTHGGKN